MPVIGGFALYRQQSFRIRNDDGSESAATWYAPLNVDGRAKGKDIPIRLRLLIQQTDATASSGLTKDFKLRYSHNGGAYTDPGTIGATSSPVSYASSSGVSDGDNTTQQIGAGSFIAGKVDNTNTTGNITFTTSATSETELEFVIMINSSQVSDTDTLAFRVYDTSNVALDTYTVTPTMVVRSGLANQFTFEFTIPAPVSTSNTATIARVDTSRSVIFYNNETTDNTGTTLREYNARVELTNATTVTGYRDTASASFGVTVRGTVVEFSDEMVESVQHGTITVSNGNTGGTATISSVTTSRSAVFYLGLTNTTSSTSANNAAVAIDLTDATTVTAMRDSAVTTAVLTVGFSVVLFRSAAIQSVQQRAFSPTGTGTSNNDTISSVTTANTILIFNGIQSSNSTNSNFRHNIQLTGVTTVTATRTGTSNITRVIRYTVLEFVSGVLTSNQRNTTAVASATSADATITGVTTSNAVCNFNGYSTTASNSGEFLASVKLQDATTVRAQKGIAGTTTSTPAWEVFEWGALPGGVVVGKGLTQGLKLHRLALVA